MFAPQVYASAVALLLSRLLIHGLFLDVSLYIL